MKNAYLNDMRNFRVYLRVIKKQKYILNKLKKRRKKIHHTYLLIVLMIKTLSSTAMKRGFE